MLSITSCHFFTLYARHAPFLLICSTFMILKKLPSLLHILYAKGTKASCYHPNLYNPHGSYLNKYSGFPFILWHCNVCTRSGFKFPFSQSTPRPSSACYPMRPLTNRHSLYKYSHAYSSLQCFSQSVVNYYIIFDNFRQAHFFNYFCISYHCD